MVKKPKLVTQEASVDAETKTKPVNTENKTKGTTANVSTKSNSNNKNKNAKKEQNWKRVKIPSTFLSGLQEAGFFGLEELDPEEADIKVIDPTKNVNKDGSESPDDNEEVDGSSEKKLKKKKTKKPKKQQQEEVEEEEEEDMLDDFRDDDDDNDDKEDAAELKKILNIESDSDDDDEEASADRLRHYKLQKGGKKLKTLETDNEARSHKQAGARRQRNRKRQIFKYSPEGELELEREATATTDEWSPFKLSPRVLLSVRKLGFAHPTPIQRAAIPAAVVAGKDIIGAAETGSGKTLAYAIPLVNGIVERKKALAAERIALEENSNEDEVGSEPPQKKKMMTMMKAKSGKMRRVRKGHEGDDDDIPEEMLREAKEMFEDEDSDSDNDNDGKPGEGSGAVCPEEENFLYGLVLTPTRELAIQVRDHIKAFAEGAGVTVEAIVGGLSAQKQERIIAGCPDVIVATTGRLWELISQQGIRYLGDLTHLMFLVLDEADRMVEAGHYKELDELMKIARSSCVEKTQTFIFSATLAVSQAKLAAIAASRAARDRSRGKKVKKPAPLVPGETPAQAPAGSAKPTPLDRVLDTIEFKRKVEIIDLTNDHVTVQGLREYKFNCTDEEKDTYLYYFLRTRKPGRTIVFANSISMVRRLVSLLRRLKICAVRLHGGIQQRQRLTAIDHFRSHDSCVMVASDVASRGLDIPDVAYVIHYNLPKTAELYVHRCGRTARAGQQGLSLALVGPSDVRQLAQIDAELGKQEPPSFPLFGRRTAGSSDLDVAQADTSVDLRKLRMILATAKELNRQIHIASSDAARRRWLLNVADQLGIDRPTGDGDSDSDEFDDEYDAEERAVFEDDELRRRKNAAAIQGGHHNDDDDDDDDDEARIRKEREVAAWKQKLATLKERLAVMLAEVGTTARAFGSGGGAMGNSKGTDLGSRPLAVSGGMSASMLDQAIAEARERRKELNAIHKKNAKAFKKGRMETITAADAFRADNYNFGTPSASSKRRKNAKKYRRRK